MRWNGFKSSLWPVFLVMAAANAWIAYGPGSPGPKLLVGLLGLGAPFFWILLKPKAAKIQATGDGRGFDTDFPAKWWMFLFLAAALVRFYALSSFSTWPATDEGWTAAYPFQLFQAWDWQWLYGPEKFPPFYFWLQVLLFKIFEPSLFSLWFLPAFLSLLKVFLAYLAARQFFSKPFALLCAGLMAFGFWPLLDGRIASVGTLNGFWELLSLWLLGLILKKPSPAPQKWLSAALGLSLACGFYSWGVNWISFWLFFHGCAAWEISRQKEKPGFWGIGLLVESVALIPLAIAYARMGVGDYVYRLSVFNSQTGWLPGVYTPWSYLTSILWGADASGFIYRPQWGGFLNPITGSFFILGLAAAVRLWKQTFWKYLLLAFPFFLLPDFFSKTFEMYRMILLMPWLALLTALGIQALVQSRQGLRWVFVVLFLASGAFDLYHLFGVYRQNWARPGIQWVHFKSLERWRAFDALQAKAQASGPGLILADFVERNYDRTLDLGTYGFDAAHNPSLHDAEPPWGAVLFPEHLKPFLQKRFPDGQWIDLSQGFGPSEQSKCLGLIPLDPGRRGTFALWQKANDAFKAIAYRMIDSPDQMTYGELKNQLERVQGTVHGDPFLESCFDQKMLGALDSGQNPKEALVWIDRDLQAGYASSFFVQKRVELLKTQKGAL